MARVLLEKVFKRFGPVEAVSNANLEVKDKEFMVFVGPSGCGKTTTLRMIAGLEEVSEGKVYIGDRCVNDVHPKDRDIAMVFQNYALYPHMTVEENMAFGLKLRKFCKSEIKQRVQTASEILGLENLLARKPKQLSGGQRQRVALGRAIVRNPLVFLMDEPLSNLDAKLRVQTRGSLKKLHERLQATIIYVTHDQVEAMTLGDRIVVMNNGTIQQADTPLNSYDTPKNQFVAGFIGSPAMNFIEGNLVRKKDEVIFEASKSPVSITVPNDLKDIVLPHLDKNVTFGIRSEDIFTEDKALKKSIEGATIKVKVDFTELLGSENFAHCTVGENKIVTRYAPHMTLNMNDQLNLTLRLSKMHLFDTKTALAIV
ncbi:MAG: sn-glycerol-3-phosphate ABC transporter ATP-binding protein UgpC [Candidatus Margulisiibacteriota bacterium]|jgi:multiple sugar transport system ATP-binding protein